ncbi:hypothetical protein HYU19_01855 [Candidatus Woesearchaeota archaeon]|nr:hypothetical protein [Candidatus Woesearchaeota archaeon]
MEQQRYYFDTSIWVDHYLKRGDHAEDVFNLIVKIIADDDIIIFSDYIEQELKDIGFSYDEIWVMTLLDKKRFVEESTNHQRTG